MKENQKVPSFYNGVRAIEVSLIWYSLNSRSASDLFHFSTAVISYKIHFGAFWSGQTQRMSTSNQVIE
jgi:hypothetical protein